MGDLVDSTELASFLQQQDLDPTTAELVIDLVEADVLATAGLAAGDCPPWVKGVVLSACARIYTNPAGLTSERIDDYTRGMAESHALLNPAERSRLVGMSGVGGAFSIDTLPSGCVVHAAICSLNFGALYCSCGASLTGGYPLWEVDP